jgi:hypothetical protein
MDVPCGTADEINAGPSATTELRPASCSPDEVLVADTRAKLRPSQFVETKLLHLLRSSTVPVSCLQGARRHR